MHLRENGKKGIGDIKYKPLYKNFAIKGNQKNEVAARGTERLRKFPF